MEHPIIRCDNLSYKYPDGNQALSGVSFCLEKGSSVGIAGANGAGKSTLLGILCGLLEHTGGSIFLEGNQIKRSNIKALRQKTGFVFQDPDDQLFTSSVYEDVAFGPVNMKLSKEETEARVREALEMTGITHLAEKPPYRLSGGEKKAASIASVLSMKPEVLIMDEPSASLDPGARRRLIELMKKMPHTKITASHDLDFLMEICDKVIIMSSGGIKAEGSTENILGNREILEECGLELPLRLQGCPLCSSGGS